MALSRFYRMVQLLKFPVRLARIPPTEAVDADVVVEALGILTTSPPAEAWHFTSHRMQKAMRLRQIVQEDYGWIMLITLGDPTAVDPAWEDVDDGSITHLPTPPNMVDSVAAHLLIAPDGNGSFAVIMEKVPGISRSVLSPFLTWLLRPIKLEVEIDNQVRKSSVIVKLGGLASRSLEETLDTGRLTQVELLKTASDIPVDGGPIVASEKVIKAKVGFGRAWRDALVRMVRIGKDKSYEDMIVHFRDEDGQALQHKMPLDHTTIEDDVIEFDERSAYFVRRRKISGLTDDLSRSAERINMEFVVRMRDVLADEVG